jgi:hypothetical protein
VRGACGAGPIPQPPHPHNRSSVLGPRAGAVVVDLVMPGVEPLSIAPWTVPSDVRNAGYIANWIELLKADKRAFFTACSKASKAADYLRALALAGPAAVAA